MSTEARRRVLDAAARLYREGGLAGVTTDALARAAGTSKRALYEHFEGRDDILEALFAERLERLAADLAAIEASADPIGRKIRRFAELVAVVPRDFPPGFLPELKRAAPAVAERVRARKDAVAHGALVRLLTAGVAAGEVRTDVPVEVLARLAEAMGDHFLTIEAPAGHSPLAVAEAGIAILLEGVLARAEDDG